jgi:pilus assembly protein CpaB
MDLFRRRLPRGAILSAALAFGCAAIAVGLVGSWANQVRATRPDLGPPVPVVVAASDLVRGTTVTSTMVSMRSMPSAVVPPGSVRSIDQVDGRVLASDIAEGEVFTLTRIAGEGVGPVAALVPPGLRGFVLPSGVPADVLRPGDLVDVLATFGANGGRPYTETVATAITILRILRDTTAFPGSEPTRGGASVVVLADPETVERLARAAALGVISVSVAGADEGSVVAQAADPAGASPSASLSPGPPAG